MNRLAICGYSGRQGPRRVLILAGCLALLGCLLAAMLSAAFGSAESQWLGMELEPLSPDLRAGLSLPAEQTGVYVSDVVGVARQCGVREGDVIVAVNGQTVQDLSSLDLARRGIDPAATAMLTINRQGNILSLPLGASTPAAPGAIVPATLRTPCWGGNAPTAPVWSGAPSPMQPTAWTPCPLR